MRFFSFLEFTNSPNDSLFHLELQVDEFLWHLWVCLSCYLKFPCHQAQFWICLLKLKRLLNMTHWRRPSLSFRILILRFLSFQPQLKLTLPTLFLDLSTDIIVAAIIFLNHVGLLVALLPNLARFSTAFIKLIALFSLLSILLLDLHNIHASFTNIFNFEEL